MLRLWQVLQREILGPSRGKERPLCPGLNIEGLPIGRREHSYLLAAPLHSWAALESNRECPSRRPGVYAWYVCGRPTSVPCDLPSRSDGSSLLLVSDDNLARRLHRKG